MEKLKKCSGSTDNGFVVGCPLRFNCKRYAVKSIGFMQEFIKPNVIKIGKQTTCQEYLDMNKNE